MSLFDPSIKLRAGLLSVRNCFGFNVRLSPVEAWRLGLWNLCVFVTLRLCSVWQIVLDLMSGWAQSKPDDQDCGIYVCLSPFDYAQGDKDFSSHFDPSIKLRAGLLSVRKKFKVLMSSTEFHRSVIANEVKQSVFNSKFIIKDSKFIKLC